MATTNLTAAQKLRRPAIFVLLALVFTAILVAAGGTWRYLAGPSATLYGIGEEKGLLGMLAELPAIAWDTIVGMFLAFVVTVVIPWLGRVILKLAGRN